MDKAIERTQGKDRYRIALDFDGVLHKYSKKWHDGTIYDDPIDGAVDAVKQLASEYDLVIFTCRQPIKDVAVWCREVFGFNIIVTGRKPHADMYIDDRGYHFDGDWTKALDEILERDEKNFGSTAKEREIWS